jgi:hypothetical protein
MTRVPDKPLQAFTLFPFETWISVAMILVGIGSLFSETTASAALSNALQAALIFVWQISVTLAGIAILGALLARPWAARRLPPVRGQRTLAMLRGVEAAACVTMATGALVYSTVLSLGNGLSLDGQTFIIAAMTSVAVGYCFRARALTKVNSDVLSTLRQFNAAHEVTK